MQVWHFHLILGSFCTTINQRKSRTKDENNWFVFGRSHIQIALQTGYPDWSIAWFSSVSWGKCRGVNFPSPHSATAPIGPGLPHYRGFTITHRHTTPGRCPLDEWSARLRDLYLATHNTHKRQVSMLPAGFETVVLSSKQSQTHALDRAATWTGDVLLYKDQFYPWCIEFAILLLDAIFQE